MRFNRIYIIIILTAVLLTASMIYYKNESEKHRRLSHLNNDAYWKTIIASSFEYDYVALSNVVELKSLNSDLINAIKNIESDPGSYIRMWTVHQFDPENSPSDKINHSISGFVDYYGKVHVLGFDWLFI